MSGFAVAAIEAMTLARRGRLAGMYVLSPFVWREDGAWHLMLRGVPRRDDEPRLKMAEVWYGTSVDGLHFEMDEGPVIFPGADAADLDGCEDPTVVVADGTTHVWYTGWNQAEATGRLLHACGPGPRTVEKRGLALDSSEAVANPKEATVVRAGAGWRLFFEYARDDASRIGLAESERAEGPWAVRDLDIVQRPDAWDSWHLSTGPIVDADGDRPVMFYNGASRDAHWRIGWVAFDRDYTRVVARRDDPVITPHAVAAGATDIAFAASAIEMGEEIWLYYSVSDQDLMRARLRRL